MTKKELIEILKTNVERWNFLNLRGANLRGANLWSANLRGADLQGAYLQGAYLRVANLCGVNLWSANLQGADLQGADLQGAGLQGADLQGADLWGANLRGANLRGANLRDAILPAPTVALLSNWQIVSDELTLDLMRYDAACHPDPKAFDAWVETNKCPYNGVKTQRAANFREKKELWSPGESKRPWDLMVRCIQEVCANSDFHEQKDGE